MNKDSSIHSGHITPLKVYLVVGFTLIVLTALTVSISFIHLGGWNVVVALFVASIKALLVALFFMHLLYDNKLYMIILTAAIGFLATLIVLTMFDTMERDRIYPIKSGPINEKAIIYNNKAADSSANLHKLESENSDSVVRH